MSNVADTAWDDEKVQAGTSTTAIARKKATTVKRDVRDDWEEDDDEDNNPTVIEAHNKKIWEEANARESRPMPSVIMSRASAASNTSSSLPLNQSPTMRILKRPSQSSSPLTNLNDTVGDTLHDREARYLAARERIFGSSATEDDPTVTQKKLPNQSLPSSSPGTSRVVRELHGPISSVSRVDSPPNKGFGDRRYNRPKIVASSKPSNDTPLL